MPLVVVTAASSNHFGALVHMLRSLQRLDARVECYDIGLSSSERRRLPRWAGASIHTFDCAQWPPHMNPAVHAGEYAWKPVIVADAIERLRAEAPPHDVLWADAGSYFH